MCSNETTQLEILKKVLDLVIVTNRDLEPWICDTICDNIRQILYSECTNDASHTHPIKPYLQDVVIHKDFFNVKLQLQITELVLLHFGQRSINPTLVLPHLDAFPAEVLDIFSLLMPFLCPECVSYEEDLTTVENVQRVSVVQPNGDLVTHVEDSETQLDGAGMLEILIKKVKESSRSLCVSHRKSAVSFMAIYCTFRLKITVNGVMIHLLDGFDDDFLCEVLIAIFEDCIDLYDGRKVAAEIVKECFNHLIAPDHKGFKNLSKIRARIMALDNNLAVEESSYCCKELYNQIFFRELCGSLLATGKQEAIQEVSAKLCGAKNLVILSVVSSQLLSDRNNPKAAKSSWEETFLNRFVSDKLLQHTMDVIYDDCANMKKQRSALSILNDLLDQGDFIDVINNSNVCHHFSKCDETNFKCFMSTYLTFLMECSVDTFSMLCDLSSKVFNLPDFAKSCDCLIPDLTRLLIRKLMSSDSRTRDLVLEFIGKLDQSLVDTSIVKFILSASYKDEDFYIKSSCFKVLSGFDSKMLPSDLCHTFNQIIKHIEHEDSMVTIAFFLFLQKHYDLVHGHIRNSLHVISNENQSQRKTSNLKNGAHQNLNLDVDSVINEVCDSADCADVSLIAAYQERETEHSTSPPEEQLVVGIFRLLASDRCDVERMKASLELIITIIRNLSESEKCLVIDFMKRGYFDLVESFNSPFLKQTIRDFNSALSGARTFSEIEKPKNQNLLTVLSLLESTPDPDIHMDCY